MNSARKILSDMGGVYLLQIASAVISLAIVASLASTLGAELFGEIAFSLAVANTIVVFQNLGIAQYGISRIVEHGPAVTAETFGQVSAFKFVLAVPLCWISTAIIPHSYLLPFLILAIANCVSTDWIFQAHHRSVEFSALSLALVAANYLALSTLVTTTDDAGKVPWIFAMYGVVLQCVSIGAAGPAKLRIGWADLLRIPETWRLSTPFLSAGLLSALKSNGGLFIYGLLPGGSALGIVAVADRIIGLASSLNVAIDRVLYPHLGRQSWMVRRGVAIHTVWVMSGVLLLVLVFGRPVAELVTNAFFGGYDSGIAVWIAMFFLPIAVTGAVLGFSVLSEPSARTLVAGTSAAGLGVYLIGLVIYYHLGDGSPYYFLLAWLSFFLSEMLMRAIIVLRKK